MKRLASLVCLSLLLTLGASSCSTGSAGDQVDRAAEARSALERLYEHTPGARDLGKHAAGILVFPDITKAGFMVGGQYGQGVLFKSGRVAGYYRSTAASYGLQAGAQKFGYALFFMTDQDLKYLTETDGWEVGVGPSLTVVDQGVARSMTTTTLRKGVYAFFFEQRGLMGGLGIQGTKISKTS